MSKKIQPKVLLKAASGYLKDHPSEIARAVKNATRLRFGVPLDALRYLIREFGGGKRAPKDITLEPSPPGLRVGLTADAMGTPIRAEFRVFVEDVTVNATALKLVVRIADLHLNVQNEGSPIAGLLKSGAIDLTKPGNLVSFLPKKPAALVEAKDDRLTFDLLKIPSLAANKRLIQALAVVTPVVTVKSIQSADDHLDFELKLDAEGVHQAIATLRA